MVARFDEVRLNRAYRHSVLPVRITRVQSRSRRAVTDGWAGRTLPAGRSHVLKRDGRLPGVRYFNASRCSHSLRRRCRRRAGDSEIA